MNKHRIIFLLLSLLFLISTISAQPKGVYLGNCTWPEAEKLIKDAPIVIIPSGAGAKEHGPHLPMNADQKVMEYLCDKAVESFPVVIAPPILHGWFPAFRKFPGTELADPTIFQDYIFEVANSLIKHSAKRVIFLNTGIFKATGLPLSIVAREIRVQSGTPTLVVSWDDLETEEVATFQDQEMGGHGDEIETSIHLYLHPNLVKMEKSIKDYGNRSKQNYSGYKPGLFSRDSADPAYSKTGIFGDPTLATAEKGKRTLEIMTKEWFKILEGFAQFPLVK